MPDAEAGLYLPEGKAVILSTHTTSDGLFDFTAVRPDVYRLTVAAKGFNTIGRRT